MITNSNYNNTVDVLLLDLPEEVSDERQVSMQNSEQSSTSPPTTAS